MQIQDMKYFGICQEGKKGDACNLFTDKQLAAGLFFRLLDENHLPNLGKTGLCGEEA